MAFWLAAGIGVFALLAAVVVWIPQLALAAFFGMFVLRSLADGPPPEKDEGRRLPARETPRGSTALLRSPAPVAGR
jgi:hypothetical protein